MTPRLPEPAGTVTVTVTLSLNFQPFVEAMNKMAKHVNEVVKRVRPFMAAVTRALRQHDEVWLSGQEARYYVRAGLDPAYATEAGLQRLVHDLMTLPGLNRRNRCRMAAAAMRGWVAHRDAATAGPLAWHRHLGTTSVQVGRAAA